MAELVQDLAMEFQLDAERKAISQRLDVASEAKMTLGDIGLIQRVLENLVRNAIKFTPEGGEITISIDESGQITGIHLGGEAAAVLQRSTREAIERAGPFPAPPKGAVKVRIPLRYTLRD